MKLPFCHVDAGSGVPEFFAVFTVSKSGIVSVLMRDGAVINLFGAAVADIRSLVQAVAAFLFKVLTGLIAGRTGSAFDTAEDDLTAGICLLTVIPVDTEVLGIVKGAFVIPVRQAVCLDFLGNSSGIFA